MEEFQMKYIKNNLRYHISSTITTSQLLAELQNSPASEGGNETTAYQKRLMTRLIGLWEAQLSFKKPCKSIASPKIGRKEEKGSLSNAKSKTAQNTEEQHVGNNMEHVLLNSISEILPLPSPYIPRMIFQRRVVNPDLFGKVCPDVFVFKETPPDLIQQLVHSLNVEFSTKLLMKGNIKTRHIILENETHWNVLCDRYNQPVHLIRYDEATDTFFLEATSGDSDVLNQYLTPTKDYCMSEDKFIDKILNDDIKVVLICDTPGMGKSSLMASMAKKILEKREGQSIGVFVEMRNFNSKSNLYNSTNHPQSLNIHSPSCKSFCVNELTGQPETQLDLFIDGLDELEPTKLEIVMNLFRDLVKYQPNVRIYVSSRPVLRAELEKTLGVIAYCIKPFNIDEQNTFLTNYWSMKHSSSSADKLKDYAAFCIHEFKRMQANEERDIAGIPLQCMLLAEVYNADAGAYAIKHKNAPHKLPNTHPGNIFQFYKRFIQTRLDNVACHDEYTSNSELFDMEFNTKCKVRSFHTWIALQYIFPEIASRFTTNDHAFENLSLYEISSPGILDDLDSSGMKFIHRTYAEYLVAEYFANSFFQKPEYFFRNKTHPISYKQLYINEILNFYDPDITDAIFPRDMLVPYFLNAMISESFEKPLSTICTGKMSSSSYELSRVLVGCLRYDYDALLNLTMKAIYNSDVDQQAHHQKFFQKYKDAALSILDVAVKFSKVATIRKLCTYFQNIFHIDLIRFCEDADQAISPIKTAILRADFQVVRYIIEMLPLENHGYLYICLENTHGETMQFVEKRLDIAQLLLSKCNSLLTESWGVYKNPLHAKCIHLEAIKFLIRQGIEFWECDDNGRTVLHLAAEYLSAEDFSDLALFLYIECNAREQFLKPEKWMQFLQMFDYQKLSSNSFVNILRLLDTTELVSDVAELPRKDWLHRNLKLAVETAFYPNYERQFYSLLSAAVDKGIEKVVKLLLSTDNSIREEKCIEERPLLYVAVSSLNFEMVKFLVENGADLFSVNSSGETSLHVAAKTAETYMFDTIVSLLVKESEKNFELSAYKIGYKTNTLSVEDILNWKEYDGSKTPLHYAVSLLRLRLETLEMLFDNACVNKAKLALSAVDGQGNTALHYALGGKQSLSIVKQLVKYGADWRMINEFGCNVTHLCAQNDLCRHLKYFLELGCDVNEKDYQGNNALQCAFNYYYEWQPISQLAEIIRTLISAGVDKQSINFLGKTAHDIARKRNFPAEILALL